MTTGAGPSTGPPRGPRSRKELLVPARRVPRTLTNRHYYAYNLDVMGRYIPGVKRGEWCDALHLSCRVCELLEVRSLLVLITVGLLAVACGGETSASPSAATPTTSTVKSSAAPVVLSGEGKATEPPPQRHATDAGTVHLGPGAYKVSWQSPDQSFYLFCGLASAKDYGITIGLAREPVNPKLVEDLVGGDYQCQASARAGTTWTVTFSPA